MNEKTLKIKDFLGQEQEVIPKLFLYEVPDFMGKKMTIPGIQPRGWNVDAICNAYKIIW